MIILVEVSIIVLISTFTINRENYGLLFFYKHLRQYI